MNEDVKANQENPLSVPELKDHMPHPDAEKRFGEAVAWYRRKAKLSQEKLGEKANLHRTYISGVETGGRNVTIRVVERLATALNVHPSVFFADWPNGSKVEAPGERCDIDSAECQSLKRMLEETKRRIVWTSGLKESDKSRLMQQVDFALADLTERCCEKRTGGTTDAPRIY